MAEKEKEKEKDKGQLVGDAEEAVGIKEREAKEGQLLLGFPTFTPLGNGRFRCSETGHEMPAKDMDSYGRSKRCRLGLIDAFLQLNKAPLNLFYQDPLSKSKLICELTGDTINKSEEHIWKHISGKRFQNKLEQKEAEKTTSGGVAKEEKVSHEASKPSISGVEKGLKSRVGKGSSQAKKPNDNNSDSEEIEFWMPPVGSRWDFDDGNDRWGSCTSSDHETDEGIGIDEADEGEQDVVESEDLSMRTKRMSIAIGPSSFASRKKKSKIESTCDPGCN